ncbi:MAG: hypothetical protein EXR54_03355 [Dehalococcoidia bacterium]|nr:hypothetical protein [Dehalococcoidia bacterium]MSQ16591.1 hypothetical protein [Dehalococcoidia bacterium]
MEFVVGAALAIFSAVVLAYPFLTARSGVESHAPVLDSPVPPPELASVYQAIRDLTWERQAGDLPEDLYQQQLDAYRRQAALLLRDAAVYSAVVGESDEALEQEVATELAARGGQTPQSSQDTVA